MTNNEYWIFCGVELKFQSNLAICLTFTYLDHTEASFGSESAFPS